MMGAWAEADADDEVVPALGEGAHGRLDGIRGPGSTSRSTMPSAGLPQAVLPSGSVPVSAHFTPAHAAALNERSSLPPMSKTMPTWTFDASSSVLHAAACGRGGDRARHQDEHQHRPARHRTSPRITGRGGCASSSIVTASLQSASAALTPRPSR